jgi:PiT family inorganic phosphate transporter
MIWFYLLSGLFLGWSLGANDTANIFGTAVGTRMIKFRTAAIVTTVFVILGAVISGAGATNTLGELGAVNAIAGSFTVALSAAVTVAWMTKLKLPVSTSQAIVGGIIGWNFFTGSPTDIDTLVKIVSTWVICPLLAAVFAFGMYKVAMAGLSRSRVHLLKQDSYNRIGLLLVGAFGAYSLGANNIANVMGVFVPANPFTDLSFNSLFTLSGTQSLFLLGAIAISIGVFTYSFKVMMTVGNDLFKLTPVAALVVVLSESVVLFLFASKGLETWLASHGLPTIPLVPVSSSHAVIGGIVGIVLAKRGRGVNLKVLGKISSGWVTTPIIAGIITFIALFFAQNVFEQKVVEKINETKIEIQPDTQIDTLKNNNIDEIQLDKDTIMEDSTKMVP